MNSQNKIYNVDETGISLKGHAPGLLLLKVKIRYDIGHQGTKIKLQLLLVLVQVDNVFHPLLFFDAKRLNYDWRKSQECSKKS